MLLRLEAMRPVSWIKDMLSRGRPESPERGILPVEEQVEAWRAASRKMKWNIGDGEFECIGTPPSLNEEDLRLGLTGVVLFYGFGDDGAGHSDAVLSGRLAWEHAFKRRKSTLWQSPYINFSAPDSFRLRPDAPPRPRGFYFAKTQTGGERFRNFTVAQARRHFDSVTGYGPEGFQFLCVTHTHYPDMMSERKVPFMALADYDVAPYGFNDFFDVPQLFSSNRVLGLGIGNADEKYPGFAIPTVRF